MNELDTYYDNMIDMLVYNSMQKFDTPFGIETGREILNRIWKPYMPEKTGAHKLTTDQNLQREYLSNRKVKLDDNNEVRISDGKNNWLDIGMSLA